MKRLMLSMAAMAAAALLGTAVPAIAQDNNFPSKPVRLLIGYPAGGPTDLMGRIVAEGLSKIWAQPVVVENKPGAGGTIAGAEAARSPADGYTLVLGNSASNGSFEVLNPTVTPYKTLEDFDPISLVGISPLMMIASKGAGTATLQEFIDKARAAPGTLNYGSSAIGSGPHLAAELLKLETKTDIVYVPFNGAAPVMQAILSNAVQMYFGAPSTVMPQVEAGNAVALAVASDERLADLPEIPTFKESGIELTMESTYGLLAPKGTPAAILDKINADMSTLLTPGNIVNDQLVKQGYVTSAADRSAYTARIKQEIAKIRRVVEQAGIRAE